MQKRYPKAAWPKKVLSDRTGKNCKIVCQQCKSEGRSAYDTDAYTCQACCKSFGCKKFDQVMLHNFRYRERSKLVCLSCSSEALNKEKRIQKQFRHSKVFCTCFCPIHAERCPLAPRYAGERRWPGCDDQIDSAERQFLDKLNPRPAWWANAWVRKKKSTAT